MERRLATPAGTARAEDPGRSAAQEAAEAVPAESVQPKRKSTFFSITSLVKEKTVGKLRYYSSLIYRQKPATTRGL
ncbi:hypothetical protein [Sporosarcina cyprini]|uniref:hypothetical protein n=1 Tax=Sporosarcina cyprini TaxID=2910523 RepID=UPI001EDFEC0A|nr:hypothetical protein [Sporosarcina cyprini]MCG3086512.1 hypothetical protein [Sporosarcina cyprini]